MPNTKTMTRLVLLKVETILSLGPLMNSLSPLDGDVALRLKDRCTGRQWMIHQVMLQTQTPFPQRYSRPYSGSHWNYSQPGHKRDHHSGSSIVLYAAGCSGKQILEVALQSVQLSKQYISITLQHKPDNNNMASSQDTHSNTCSSPWCVCPASSLVRCILGLYLLFPLVGLILNPFPHCSLLIIVAGKTVICY